MIEKGLSEFSKIKTNELIKTKNLSFCNKKNAHLLSTLHVYDSIIDPIGILKRENGFSTIHIKDRSLIAEDLKKNTQKQWLKYSSVKEKIDTVDVIHKGIPDIELSDQDKKLLRELEREHENKIKQNNNYIIDEKVSTEITEFKKNVYSEKFSAKRSIMPKDTLSKDAKERTVPASRIGRIISFGSLGVGLGIGTLAEYTRRTLKPKDHKVRKTHDNIFLTKANAERIVTTLCKVRGAALKIGQILSIQDDTVISPEFQKAFERVRQSADFMPAWQVKKVLANQLGDDWREKLDTFSEKPFAAASIGQVHHATLFDGRSVAIKIQYPGVADGIQSDIDNLMSILKVWNIFPEGLFLDNIVDVAKRELTWEVDYIREAECTRLYKKLIDPHPEYYVPEVIDHLSTAQVLTTELIDGIPVDKCESMDLAIKENICKLIMNLCLKELFEFRYMQTDPNWSNFFYNPITKQMILLDFGACRNYSKQFMDDYIAVIYAASQNDRSKVLSLSRKMKFLTGYESKLMEEAHVDAVMILGQVFDNSKKSFNFGAQDVTKRIQALVPTIVYHRLCPPPEEIYSLHRKLSGVFLLCAKMNVNINCRDMFQEVYRNYRFG